jgi:hypothetical protein
MFKRFILWDFARASWQYDVMVGLILVFIFVTPRNWFFDQPRIPKASDIVMVHSESGRSEFWIRAQILERIPEGQQTARLTELLQSRTSNRNLSIIRLEQIVDSEGELQGYMAFAKP